MNRRIGILGGLEGGSEYVIHLVFSSKKFIDLDEAAMMIDTKNFVLAVHTHYLKITCRRLIDSGTT